MPSSSTTITESQAFSFSTALNFTRSKYSWPNPEHSIGRRCESISGFYCWEAEGPARELSNKIFPDIARLLESRNEYLNEGEPVPRLIMYGMYMIGRIEAAARPTVLFSCQSKNPRKKALKLVKKSNVLKDIHGVMLADSSRPPLAQPTPVLLAKEDRRRILLRDTAYIEASSYGASKLIISSSNGSPSDFTKATLGGILALGDKFYALTVAHPFIEPMQSEAQATDDRGEIDLSFDDDTDDDAFASASLEDATNDGMLSLLRGVMHRIDHNIHRIPIHSASNRFSRSLTEGASGLSR